MEFRAEAANTRSRLKPRIFYRREHHTYQSERAGEMTKEFLYLDRENKFARARDARRRKKIIIFIKTTATLCRHRDTRILFASLKKKNKDAAVRIDDVHYFQKLKSL